MVNHAPKCVFFTISLLVSFDIALVMENEDFNSVLKQAVQRLLQRHAACTILPVEQRLDVLLDGFPDPSSFLLPNTIVWEPHLQLRQFLPPEFLCPNCNEDGKAISLIPNGWKDGHLRRHTPRKMYGLFGKVLLLSRVYCCSAGHEINGHDPIILAMITSRVRIPFLLSHKSGVTKELLDLFVSMVRNGLSFSQIHDIMFERLHVRHLEQESRFLEDFDDWHYKCLKTFIVPVIQS